MICPYFNLPSTSLWKHEIANRPYENINPHLPSKLTIKPDMRVGSAGSCFAQHISKALVKQGYNYFITEMPPENVPTAIADKYGYGLFSARYGNIYTPLQLLQLLERAFNGRSPVEQIWVDSRGRVYDLLRPRIMPDGFSSYLECQMDLESHLTSVKKLFCEMDIFIFTLGLTEAWLSKNDETVYPTCPGCGSPGIYDPDKYKFHNFNVKEITDDLNAAIYMMLQINPKIQIILTVSPVPLLATMESRHILQATTFSKSVLRIAAEEIIKKHPNVHYFASYELITATGQTNVFFEEDRRTISAAGIEYAMNVFFNQFAMSDRGQIVSEIEMNNNSESGPGRPFCDEEDFYRAVSAIVKNV